MGSAGKSFKKGVKLALGSCLFQHGFQDTTIPPNLSDAPGVTCLMPTPHGRNSSMEFRFASNVSPNTSPGTKGCRRKSLTDMRISPSSALRFPEWLATFAHNIFCSAGIYQCKNPKQSPFLGLLQRDMRRAIWDLIESLLAKSGDQTHEAINQVVKDRQVLLAASRSKGIRLDG